jgi:hypothetical protein
VKYASILIENKMKNIVIAQILVISAAFFALGQSYSATIYNERENRLGNNNPSVMPVSYMNSAKARAESIIKKLDAGLLEETTAVAVDTEELPLAATRRKVAEPTEQKPLNIHPEVAQTAKVPEKYPEPSAILGRAPDKTSETGKSAHNTNNNVTDKEAGTNKSSGIGTQTITGTVELMPMNRGMTMEAQEIGDSSGTQKPTENTGNPSQEAVSAEPDREKESKAKDTDKNTGFYTGGEAEIKQGRGNTV